MACNSNWLTTFYYRPIQEIESLIRNYKKLTIKESDVEPSTPIVKKDFKTIPVNTYCYYCKNEISTVTELKFNILTCVCFIICNFYYCIFQACRNKEILCFDCIHRCPKCGRVLGEYKSCC